MYSALVEQHIRNLKGNIFQRGTNYVLVYKGFPVQFLMDIGNTFRFLSNKPPILTSGKIDLATILEKISTLISHLLDNKRGIRIMTYEEFILLSLKIDLSLYKGQIIVFENNFFSEFPNQSTEKFVDIDREIENNHLDFKENNLFSTFYADSSVSGDVHFVLYKDVNLEHLKNTHTEPFFDRKVLDSALDFEEIESGEISEKKSAVFPSSLEYSELKRKLFFGEEVEKDFALIADRTVLSNRIHLNELKIAQHLFRENGRDIRIYIRKSLIQRSYRQEFLVALKKYWQSDRFRELTFYANPDLSTDKIRITQGSVIEFVVQQVEKAIGRDEFNDIFLTAPTGSGKSILFQIPASYIAKKSSLVTIVVCPLKALMYDQVCALRDRGINFATYINSDISMYERQNIINAIKEGEISVVYLSPELLLSYDLRYFIGDRELGLLVIDEAHLVTTWGRDFRIDYWYLGNYIRKLRKYHGHPFPVFALTATAVYGGKNDIVFETVGSLNLPAPKLYIGNVRRDEVNFKIEKFQYKGNHELAKIEKTKRVLMNNVSENTKTIAYFPWTNQIKIVRNEIPGDYESRIGIYYAKVDKTEKQVVVEKFAKGEIAVILATKAFGMGVDIGDIKVIYHHAPSGSLSDYVQEIGRVARDKGLEGSAVVDFCPKDLKFTRILYGLSSIKQYQVKLALQKIWTLYSYKKKQNLLVSVEDFAFIFSDEVRDLESKVKSALLLLEKDLESKYHYRILIIRPKSLFSNVFACVPSKIEDKFMNKYGAFCRKCCTVSGNVRKSVEKKPITTYDVGDIYEIQLNNIWEHFFGQESFPMVKKRFFDGTLFEEFNDTVVPRYKLTVNLLFSRGEALKRMDDYFSTLDLIFKGFSGKYFSRREFEREARKRFTDDIFARRVTNLIVNLYTSPAVFTGSGQRLRRDTFLQTKRNDDGEEVLRVISSAYIRVRHYSVQKFNTMFVGTGRQFIQYISVNSPDREFRIKIAYLLESLLLGSYELVGGRLPQIFVRINDPYQMRLLADSREYSNDVLTNINQRHKDAVSKMEVFFTSQMDKTERWDFIERYFLGGD